MDKNKNIIIYILIIVFVLVSYYTYKYIIKTEEIKLICKSKLIKYINKKLNCNKKNLFIVIIPELGDNIILNGAIRYYSTIYDNVILTCKKSYYSQISYMYRDLDNLLLFNLPNEFLVQYINYYIPIDDEIINMFKKYNITYLNQINICSESMTNFIHNFIHIDNVRRTYDSLHLNENIAYDYFKVVRDYNSENMLYNKLINIIGIKYVIIIDDEKRNFLINDAYTKDIKLPIFKLSTNSTNTDNRLNEVRSKYIFDYIKILENAQLVLSIDSSIPWLVNFLNLTVNMYIYPARYENIIYKNKNMKKLDVYTEDFIKSNLNFDNHGLKYPYEKLLSYIM
jgi:hypothetical protein